MPIGMKIDSANNLVVYTVTGVITAADIQEVVEARVAAPDYMARMDVLWDFREGQLSPVPQDLTYQGAQVMKGMPHAREEAKIAVVAPKTATHGMMREFKAWWANQPREFEVFWTIEEAMAWLGLENKGSGG